LIPVAAAQQGSLSAAAASSNLARVAALPNVPTARRPFANNAEEQGAKAVAMNPGELAELGAAERKRWDRIVKAANIKSD
jgi:tripartite-type tricarboxylate transporter receptor subunit TctC